VTALPRSLLPDSRWLPCVELPGAGEC